LPLPNHRTLLRPLETGGPKTLLGTEDESIEKDNTVDEEAPLTAVSDSADEIPADEFNDANDDEKI